MGPLRIHRQDYRPVAGRVPAVGASTFRSYATRLLENGVEISGADHLMLTSA
jgi:hypothetical protein